MARLEDLKFFNFPNFGVILQETGDNLFCGHSLKSYLTRVGTDTRKILFSYVSHANFILLQRYGLSECGISTCCLTPSTTKLMMQRCWAWPLRRCISDINVWNTHQIYDLSLIVGKLRYDEIRSDYLSAQDISTTLLSILLYLLHRAVFCVFFKTYRFTTKVLERRHLQAPSARFANPCLVYTTENVEYGGCTT